MPRQRTRPPSLSVIPGGAVRQAAPRGMADEPRPACGPDHRTPATSSFVFFIRTKELYQLVSHGAVRATLQGLALQRPVTGSYQRKMREVFVGAMLELLLAFLTLPEVDFTNRCHLVRLAADAYQSLQDPRTAAEAEREAQLELAIAEDDGEDDVG